MKIRPQDSPERTRLGELLEDFSVAMMIGRDDDGTLVGRPMSALEMDAEGALWFFTQKKSARTDALPELNLSFCDRSSSTYVSLSGQGRIEHDSRHIERLWTPFARPWFPQGSGSADLVLLRFTPERADVWDGPSSSMVRVFALAASVIAGQPIGLGEHDTLNDISAR